MSADYIRPVPMISLNDEWSWPLLSQPARRSCFFSQSAAFCRLTRGLAFVIAGVADYEQLRRVERALNRIVNEEHF